MGDRLGPFLIINWNLVRFAHNWNDGMLEYWNNGVAPFGQDVIPPTAGKAAKFRMLWIAWKVA
jgi:hypothetical protein